MRDQINILVDLQRIESETAALASDVSAVPKAIAALDAELREAERQIVQREEMFGDQKKKYRGQESEVQQIAARIKSSQAKLHAVKTNREYQALLKEIEDLQAKNSSLEDDMLEFLEHMDQTQSEITAERTRFRQQEETVGREKAMILEEAEKKRSRLARLKEERARTIERLNPSILKRFKQVMATHSDGRAVAFVENAVCSGCNLNIPPQMYIELQKCETIRLCPTCERIIYRREE